MHTGIATILLVLHCLFVFDLQFLKIYFFLISAVLTVLRYREGLQETSCGGAEKSINTALTAGKHIQSINQSNLFCKTQNYDNKLKSAIKHKSVVYRTPRQV